MMKIRDSLYRVLVLLAVSVSSVSIISAQSVVKVVGERVKFVLSSDGSLRGCCSNDYNQISATNGPAKGLIAVELAGKVLDVAVSDRTVYAVLDDGSVWAWGQGSKGELGNGGNSNSRVPLRVTGISNAMQVVAENGAALVLTKEGAVFAWGDRGSGLVGDGLAPKKWADPFPPPALKPIQVPNVAGIKYISAKGGTVLALTNDGRVLAWGSNFNGALGRAPRQELPIDLVGEVPGLRDVIAVAVGQGVSTALRRDGTVWVWGTNSNGQFGNGDRDGSVGMNVGWHLEPRKVPGIANVVAIAVGMTGRHTLALLKDGTLRGWGNTDWGQLGAGVAGTFQESPVIPKISGVKAIFAAGNNSFALKNDDSFWAWGSGGRGEWPFAANTKVPTQVNLK